MDFIRYEKAQPGYDPNTRHCLYGLDADLVRVYQDVHRHMYCTYDIDVCVVYSLVYTYIRMYSHMYVRTYTHRYTHIRTYVHMLCTDAYCTYVCE